MNKNNKIVDIEYLSYAVIIETVKRISIYTYIFVEYIYLLGSFRNNLLAWKMQKERVKIILFLSIDLLKK